MLVLLGGVLSIVHTFGGVLAGIGHFMHSMDTIIWLH